MRPIWRAIGYDEINWTYTPRGRALHATLKEIFRGPLAVRNHNAFTSGNGLGWPAWSWTNLYRERIDGSMALDWRWADGIYDVFAEHGWEPVVDWASCPRPVGEALRHRRPGAGPASGPRAVRGRRVALPAKELRPMERALPGVRRPLVERYGVARVERWRFEVWNEPDIPYYWRGSLDEYCQLYEASRTGVRMALPGAQVGGPATTEAGTEFLRRMLERVSQPDFVSFHTKGAYYSPRRHYNPFVPGPREAPSLGKMVEDVRRNVAIIREHYPDVPILVNECDPAVGTPYGVFDTPNFVVVNTTHYPTMVCALAKELLEYPTVERFTSWAFYMEGKRWFEGNRALVTNENVELPVLDGFRMLERLGVHRVDAHAEGVGALAGDRAVIIYHHADAWWVDGTLPVLLRCEGAARAVRFWRLGSSHARWLEMSAPDDPSPEQVAQLRQASGLKELETIATEGGRLLRRLDLPVHTAILCEVLG